MLNFQKLSQTVKSQAIASQQSLPNHSQLWQEIGDTPAQNIQGGWGSGGGGGSGGGPGWNRKIQ